MTWPDGNCAAQYELSELILLSGIVRPEARHASFEYQYDPYGNWTERIVWQRMEPNADERPSNIERRKITYYGP